MSTRKVKDGETSVDRTLRELNLSIDPPAEWTDEHFKTAKETIENARAVFKAPEDPASEIRIQRAFPV